MTHVSAAEYCNTLETNNEGMSDVSFSLKASDNPAPSLCVWGC